MKITVLGTSGWMSAAYQTSTIMVEHRNALILLDAGTGIVNLNQYQTVLDHYETIYILLSHYHLDHIIGLTYLLPYVKDKKLVIYGPGTPIYTQSCASYLEKLIQPPYFSRNLSQLAKEVHCRDYPAMQFTIEDITISLKLQTHDVPSLRITIDDQLIYASDTAFYKEDWTNCYGEVLLHECFTYIEKSHPKHTALHQLIYQLPCDHFQSIYLIHHHPLWDLKDYQTINEYCIDTNIQTGSDHLVIDLHDPSNRNMRIQSYEASYDYLSQLSHHGTSDDYAIKYHYQRLNHYLNCGLWLEDYIADEQQNLDPSLKRGVLSQDGLYNLLEHVQNQYLKGEK